MRRARGNQFVPLPVTALCILVQFGLAGCAATISTNSSDPPSNGRNSSPPPSGSGSIIGAFIDDSTQRPVPGATVLLEQADAAGIDRVVKSTTTVPDGTFAFNDLASGNYDLVAAASVTSGGSTTTYATTVTFRVPVDSTLNGVPLVPQFGDSMPYGLPVDLGAGGTITASGNGPAQVDVQLSAFQAAMTHSGTLVQVTIPTFAGSAPEITTMPGSNCPSGTDCASFSLLVPSSSPVVGTYDPMQTSYMNPTFGPQEVIYTVEGRAFVHGTNNPNCSPSSLTVGPLVPRGTVASKIPNLSFAGCQ